MQVRTGQRVDSITKSEGRFHLSASNREKEKVSLFLDHRGGGERASGRQAGRVCVCV